MKLSSYRHATTFVHGRQRSQHGSAKAACYVFKELATLCS